MPNTKLRHYKRGFADGVASLMEVEDFARNYIRKTAELKYYKEKCAVLEMELFKLRGRALAAHDIEVKG